MPRAKTATGLPLTRDDITPPPVDSPEVAHISPDLRALAFPMERLIHLPGNARHGDVEFVAGSLETFQQRKNIVVNRLTGHIEAGNTTFEGLREIGVKWAAVVLVEDDPSSEAAFAIVDNRANELGFTNPGALLSLYEQVDKDLTAFLGYDTSDLADLRAEAGATDNIAGVDEDGDVDRGTVVDYGRTMNEQQEGYEASGVRSIVLAFELAQHAWVTSMLERLRKETGYESNTEVILWLIGQETGSDAPNLDPPSA